MLRFAMLKDATYCKASFDANWQLLMGARLTVSL